MIKEMLMQNVLVPNTMNLMNELIKLYQTAKIDFYTFEENTKVKLKMLSLYCDEHKGCHERKKIEEIIKKCNQILYS